MELTGRITADAVVSTIKNGKQVVEFSIAINDYYKPKGALEGKQVTQYVACSYWLNTAIAVRLVKGSIAEVSGRIRVQAYTGKDGTAKATLNMHCNSIKIHSTKSKKDSADRQEHHVENGNVEQQINTGITEPLDDIPF